MQELGKGALLGKLMILKGDARGQKLGFFIHSLKRLINPLRDRSFFQICAGTAALQVHRNAVRKNSIFERVREAPLDFSFDTNQSNGIAHGRLA